MATHVASYRLIFGKPLSGWLGNACAAVVESILPPPCYFAVNQLFAAIGLRKPYGAFSFYTRTGMRLFVYYSYYY